MAGEVTAPKQLVDIVRFFKVLADESRLAMVQTLALSDLRAGEIVERLRLPANVGSYHLKQLRSLGLLRDRRSSSDARDIYYSVDLDRLETLYAAAGAALHPGMTPDAHEDSSPATHDRPLRVLFICTHNSARSQLAEGIMRHLGGDRVEVFSAGSDPAEVHPMALALLEEWDIDTSRHTAKSLDQFLDQQFDYVITVCDRVRDTCPTFPGDPQENHWSIADPAAVEDDDERWRAFQEVRRELCTRIRYLLSLRHPATGRRMQLPTRSGGAAGAA